MPDGTSRLSKNGKEIFHFMGCSTFAEYAVIAEISAAKIHPGADLYKMCLLGRVLRYLFIFSFLFLLVLTSSTKHQDLRDDFVVNHYQSSKSCRFAS